MKKNVLIMILFFEFLCLTAISQIKKIEIYGLPDNVIYFDLEITKKELKERGIYISTIDKYEIQMSELEYQLKKIEPITKSNDLLISYQAKLIIHYSWFKKEIYYLYNQCLISNNNQYYSVNNELLESIYFFFQDRYYKKSFFTTTSNSK
jgi:hypothetical protein